MTVDVKSCKLTVVGGSFTDCYMCDKRWEDKPMEFHHTSYENNEGVFICGSCHTNIHQKPDRYPKLAPDVSRKDVRGKILTPTDYSVKVPLMPELYDRCKIESEYYNISMNNLVRVCVNSVIEYGDGSLIDGIRKVEEGLE